MKGGGHVNGGSQDTASALASRGTAYYRLNDYGRARRDYNEAIRLDSTDAASYYNLGLVDEREGSPARAVDDYSAAIRVRPDDVDTFLNRGNALLDIARFGEAVSDFTRAHELKPNDMIPIASRGLTYAWMKDRASAQRDFAVVRFHDPGNVTMLHGEALLSSGAGDFEGAVDNLTASLKSDPSDRWALRMRAEMYSRLGDEDNYYADKDTLWRLSRAETEAKRSQ